MQPQRRSPHDGHDAAATDGTGETQPTVPFELLRSGRRRRVVRYLLAFVDEPVALEDLAAAIARRELDGTTGGVDPEACERVAISLEHSHLPKLAAAGIVDDDWERGHVTATSRIERLAPYVQCGGSPHGDTGGAGTPSSSTDAVGAGRSALYALRDRPVVGFLAGVTLGLSVQWLLDRVVGRGSG